MTYDWSIPQGYFEEPASVRQRESGQFCVWLYEKGSIIGRPLWSAEIWESIREDLGKEPFEFSQRVLSLCSVLPRSYVQEWALTTMPENPMEQLRLLKTAEETVLQLLSSGDV